VGRIPADKTLVSTDSTYQIVDFFKVKGTHIPAIASSHFKIIDNLYSEFFMTPQHIYIICFNHLE
jgi:hypothetical protein